MIFDLDGFFCMKGALELCLKFLEFTVKSFHADIHGLNCIDSSEERI